VDPLLDESTDSQAAAARRRAHQAASQVWARTGRPGVRLSPGEHAALYRVLHEHVVARFGCRLTVSTCSVVVEIALSRFLPPLYLRHSSEIGKGPDDLLRELDDVALDLLRKGGSTQGQSPTQLAVPADESDAELVQSVFGYDDAVYAAALREVQLDDARMEYLVVTEYMTRRQVLGHPPQFVDVAEALSLYGVTPRDVERLMFRFSSRMAALAR
jgi:hypothetical protein